MSLNLVPTKDLMEEVQKRYKSVVITALLEGDEIGSDEYLCVWKGSLATCLGLCEFGFSKIVRELEDLNEEA